MRHLFGLRVALGFALLARPEPPKELELVLSNVTVYPEPHSHPPVIFEPCDTLDPRSDPDDAFRVIAHVSRQTKVPEDILFGIWKYESGEVEGDRGGAGQCNAWQQLEIRCRFGHNCQHKEALQLLAQRFSWDLTTLRGSCGRSTMTHNKGNFGGCIGPMQISPAEWVQHEKYANKNPLNLCWSMMETAERLHRYFGQKRKAGGTQDEAWDWAIRRYHGNADNPVSMAYLAKVDYWRGHYRVRAGGPRAFVSFHARLSADKPRTMVAVNQK